MKSQHAEGESELSHWEMQVGLVVLGFSFSFFFLCTVFLVLF